VHVAHVGLIVKSAKRAEFFSTVERLVERMRRLPGCASCRLTVDYVDSDSYVLTSDWEDPSAFAAFTRSQLAHVLFGMRGLLEAEPRLTVDEVERRTEGWPPGSPGAPVR